MAEPEFERPDLLQIFPTFVWRARLAEGSALNAGLLDNLRQIGAPLTGLKPGENWQSEQDLHTREAFQPLVRAVHTAAAGLLDYLRMAGNPLVMTGCWANLNAPGTPHRLHSHRNNFLSGVYYVRVPPGAGSINFYDPRPQAGVIRPPAVALTPENTEMVVLKVEEGTMLLFPAWLQHAVDANPSGDLRISISFNLMFDDFAQTMSRPAWTPGKGQSG